MTYRLHYAPDNASLIIRLALEELGLPYELRWHDRGPDFLAPDSYRALHPAATAPVIPPRERPLVNQSFQ
mgnify:CR=1 FL=1